MTDAWSLYSTPRGALQRFAISCYGAGEQSGQVHHFKRRTLSTHGMVLVTEGGGTYTEYVPRRRDIRVEGPAIIWLAPGVEHGYGPDDLGWSEHWVLFGGQALAAFEELGLGRPHRPVTPLAKRPAESPSIFMQLRNALKTVGSKSDVECSVLIQRLLLSVLDAFGDDPEGLGLVHLDGIARGAFRPTTVAARSREAGVSSHELRDLVRVATGLTVNEFVIQVRIAKAQALLVETKLKVGEIAHQVGYDDPAFFSRIFSARVGISPIKFRGQQARTPVG